MRGFGKSLAEGRAGKPPPSRSPKGRAGKPAQSLWQMGGRENPPSGANIQRDMKVATGMERIKVRVVPPNRNSRSREWL